MNVDTLQWMGASMGILGALLLAIKSRHAGLGWIFFLASNAYWIAYGLSTHQMGLVTMQIVYSCTSFIGAWTWLVLPRRKQSAAVKLEVKVEKNQLRGILS